MFSIYKAYNFYIFSSELKQFKKSKNNKIFDSL